MVRPKDMGPADLAPNTAPPETFSPEDDLKVQRNAFYNSLAVGAKDAFLRALEDAASRGISEEAAWSEAVLAAQSYTNEDVQPLREDAEDMRAASRRDNL